MATVTNLPVDRNVPFTGRVEALGELDRALREKWVAVVQGPGGIGKTELALEYARRNAARYDIVWIFRCDQPAALQAGIMRLAEKLGLDVSESAPETLRNDLRRLLTKNDDWLLIFDGAPAPADIETLLPPRRGGHVIVTSAKGKWNDFGGAVHLSPLSRQESVELLQARTKRHSDEDAEKLAKALGDIPLAIELAAAMIDHAKLSFRGYLKRFEDLWAELLQTGAGATSHPSAIAMAWELSFRQLQDLEPVSAELVTLCAYLSPQEIRLGMLHDGSKFAPHPLAPVMADGVRLSEVARAAAKLSLADADERHIGLRADTAVLARNRLDADQRKSWARVALRVAQDAFTYRPMDLSSHRKAAEVLPHLIAAAGHAEALDLEPVSFAKAYDDAGQFLYERGHYRSARDLLQRALAAAQTAYGAEHPRVSSVSNNLARALARAGELDKARDHFETAIQIDSAKYGYANPRVATLVNNYGRYHFAKGDLGTARQQFEWAKSVFEGHYGGEHPRVAATINNIGYVHSTAGETAEARKHLEQALAMAEKTYPEGHPDVARIASNLGRVAQAQGDRSLAKHLFEKALLIDRAAHGHEHPSVAFDLIYLGDYYLLGKEYVEAEKTYHQALTTAEASFGPYHPEVVTILRRLARARKANGDLDGAAWCIDRAAAIGNRNSDTGIFAAAS